MGLSWALTQKKVVDSASANKFSEFMRQANQKAGNLVAMTDASTIQGPQIQWKQQ